MFPAHVPPPVSGQSGEELRDGRTTEYQSSLVPLSICDEGLETRDGRQFPISPVSCPAEYPSLMYASDALPLGDYMYQCDLTLICTCNH